MHIWLQRRRNWRRRRHHTHFFVVLLVESMTFREWNKCVCVSVMRCNGKKSPSRVAQIHSPSYFMCRLFQWTSVFILCILLSRVRNIKKNAAKPNPKCICPLILHSQSESDMWRFVAIRSNNDTPMIFSCFNYIRNGFTSELAFEYVSFNCTHTNWFYNIIQYYAFLARRNHTTTDSVYVYSPNCTYRLMISMGVHFGANDRLYMVQLLFKIDTTER